MIATEAAASSVVVDGGAKELPGGAGMLVHGAVAPCRVPVKPILKRLSLLVPRRVVGVFVVPAIKRDLSIAGMYIHSRQYLILPRTLGSG